MVVRRSLPRVALLLVVTLGYLWTGSATSTAVPEVAPADGAVASGASCSTPAVSIVQPRPASTVRDDTIRFSGTGPARGGPVQWSAVVADDTAQVLGSTGPVGTDGSWSFGTSLAQGEWTVTATAKSSAAVSAPCTTESTELTVLPPQTWLAGAAGAGVADGSFGDWRGAAVPLAGTWADNNQAMTGLWQLRSGGEFAGWNKDLDIAIGAIGPGETWKQAAQGAYDARWSQSLSELTRLWGARPGHLYIRFAHEFNGNWYPWSVTAESASDFRVAWQRFRNLQLQLAPAASLVFSVNSETSSSTGLDWRTAFPGAAYVDVMGVDYYNMYPWVSTVAEWDRAARSVDKFGAPRGIERHREFAESVGLPFAVTEWGNNADFGDSPVYVDEMNKFFADHAGRGPGRLIYEILFNVEHDRNPWELYPKTGAPLAAETYSRLW